MPGRLAPNMLVPGQLPEYSSYKFAPVAQRIEHWPPEPGAAVRVRPGAPPHRLTRSHALANAPESPRNRICPRSHRASGIVVRYHHISRLEW